MKTMQKYLTGMLLAGVIMAASQWSCAQGFVDSLSQDESNIVSAIAPYAPDVRAAILNVSQYPHVLVKIERAQARTSQAFQDIVALYPRGEQEKLYQVARFPGLVSQLAKYSGRSGDDMKALIKDYPEAIQQPLQDVYSNHFNDLVKMDAIYQSSQNTMNHIVDKYPRHVQDDFKKVISNPDVMTLLTDNIDLTVSLGESYKSDPQGTIQYFDSLGAALDGQNSKDLAEYKNAVESDPKLQAEMKKAAEDFADQYDQQGTTGNVTNSYHGAAPYPYWFGYPYWYNSPMWYPTPFYYNTGFYYGPGGGLVVVGLPSFAYAYWFFGNGYCRYPRLYGHYNTYYNVHRAHMTNINVYRGFNMEAHGHFGAISRGRAIQNRTRMRNMAPGQVGHVRGLPVPRSIKPSPCIRRTLIITGSITLTPHHFITWAGSPCTVVQCMVACIAALCVAEDSDRNLCEYLQRPLENHGHFSTFRLRKQRADK